jgi:hypothetical protein
MDDVGRTYEYQPSDWGILLVFAATLVILAPFFWLMSRGGDYFRFLFGEWFTAGLANVLGKALAVLCLAGGVRFALGARRLRGSRAHITFTPESIVIPASAINTPMVALPALGVFLLAPIPSSQVVVPYKDISNVAISKRRRRRFVRFSYSGGYTGDIRERQLPSMQVFDEICARLTERVGAATATAPRA